VGEGRFAGAVVVVERLGRARTTIWAMMRTAMYNARTAATWRIERAQARVGAAWRPVERKTRRRTRRTSERMEKAERPATKAMVSRSGMF